MQQAAALPVLRLLFSPGREAPLELHEIAKSKAALQTLAFAYALVVFADARLAHSEKAMFDRLLRSHSSFRSLPEEKLRFYFEEAASLLVENYASRKPEILARIEKIGDTGFSRKAIMALVRTAVIADGKIKPQEEAILKEIEETMHLKPGSL